MSIHSERRTKWQKLRPEQRVKRLIVAARANAKRLGIKFTITADDVVLPNFCPVLGIPLSFEGPPFSPNLPSLDRVIPELGYVPGNVNIISWRANRLKVDCQDPAELRAVADYLERELDMRRVKA